MIFSLFKSRTKTSLSDFTADYIGREILTSYASRSIYYDFIKEQIAQNDKDIIQVNANLFKILWDAVRLEILGLIVMNKLNDKAAILFSTYAFEILQRTGHEIIWIKGEDFNQAVAQAGSYRENEKDELQAKHFGNVFRTGLFKKYVQKGFDPKCTARALNRLLTVQNWHNSIIPSLLASVLCTELGMMNSNARKKITAMLMVCYDDMAEEIKGANLKIE